VTVAFEHDFKDGESIWIGDARITLLRLSKGRTRMRIEAPKQVPIEIESRLTFEEARAKVATLREQIRDDSS
jgi:sRNA-binding carbon storage regulator CsrA|tara:strand:+ start:204 stop:419 length:216 start_codon:yes stop_codon:yes gene_type:complete